MQLPLEVRSPAVDTRRHLRHLRHLRGLRHPVGAGVALVLTVAFALTAGTPATVAAAATVSPLATVLSNATVAAASHCRTVTATHTLEVRGVVFDAAGNIFVSDTGTAGGGGASCSTGADPGGIWEVPSTGPTTWGTPKEVIPFSAGNQPNGLAIDSSGNLYVADNGGKTIYEFAKQGTDAQGYARFASTSCTAAKTPAPNPSCYQQQVIATTPYGPVGVTAAPDGSLYFFDRPAGVVEHAQLTTGSWHLTSTGIPITASHTYAGIALSSAGNLFYDDYSTGVVYEAKANGRGGFTSPQQLATTARTGANFLAVDSYGNVFYVDSSNATLYEVPFTSKGGKFKTAKPMVTHLASYAVGMGIDSLDRFYVQDATWDLAEYGTPLQTQPSTSIVITSTPPPTATTAPGGSYTVLARPGGGTDSTTTITVSVTPGTATTCAASGTTVTFLASGTCTVRITRGGDGTYAPYQTTQTFVIGSASVPSPPNNPAVAPGDGQVTLYWTPPTNDGGSKVLGYDVYEGTAAGGEGASPVNSSLVTATQYTVTGLPDGTTFWFTVKAVNGVGSSAPSTEVSATPHAPKSGYWEVAADGGVFAFGDAPYLGSEAGQPLDAPVVGIAATPDGKGYWEVAADGGIFAFGDAGFYGSMGGKALDAPVVGIAATPDGKGYWEVAADGGIFAFGDAPYLGSEAGKPLNRPVVGIAATPDGKGYWEVAADGGVFAFGDAPYLGSEGGKPLNRPVVGIAATPDGKGYWEVAADGGIFAAGTAQFYGSMSGARLNAPSVGLGAVRPRRPI